MPVLLDDTPKLTYGDVWIKSERRRDASIPSELTDGCRRRSNLFIAGSFWGRLSQ